MNLKEYFKKYTKQSKKGFTLVEAITVVIIMSIISTASISVFLSVRDTVRDTSNITTDQHRADQIEQFLRNEFQTASKIDLVELEGQAPKDFSPVKNDEYMLYNPENEQLISVTSSNQKLVSAYVERYNASYYRLVISVHSDILAPGKSGTAKITVKANDGSGTSYSFTVKATGAYG